MATEKQKIDRHLAIYEKAGLNVKSISIWPFAMANSYAAFFSRREDESNIIAMLMDVGRKHTNVVICKAKNVLFARLIPVGASELCQGEMAQKLIAEIDACGRYFESLSKDEKIERLIFLAGQNVDKSICEKIAELAKRMQVQAQIGDVLAAIDVMPGCNFVDIDRRNSKIDWTTTFGLSLVQV